MPESIIYSIAHSIGVRIRFYFLKAIGYPKPLKYLKGNSKDGANNLSHGCINTLIGIPVVFGIIIGLVYLYFTFLA